VTSVWSRDPRVLWRRCGWRTLLLTPTQDRPAILEGPGPAVWDLLAEPVDEDELVASLSALFDAEAGAIRGEVLAFLERLESSGAATRAR
jgi:hypothetical protein